MITLKQAAKFAAACSLAICAISASATDISLYGRVDAGLRYTHSDGDDTLELYSGNRSTNRFGFNIVEDLGNGMKAKAYLENGFKIDTGSLGTSDTLFDRRSILALQGGWGEVGMGRMGTVQSTVAPYTMGLIKYDPFGTSYSQASIGTTFANTSRVNNAITWISPAYNGWKVGATYSLGDASDDDYDVYADRDHTLALATDFTSENLYLSFTYATVAYGDKDDGSVVKFKDSDGEVIDSRALDHNSQLFGMGGWWRVTPATKLYAGVQYQSHWEKAAGIGLTKTVSESLDDLSGGYDGYSCLLGATYEFGANKILGGIQYFDGELSNDSSVDYKFTVLAAAFEHKLAKTTWLYIAATHSMASGNLESKLDAVGKSEEATELMAGLNWNF